MQPVPLATVYKIEGDAIKGLRPAFDRSESHTAEFWLSRCKADMAQLWRMGDLWAVSEVQDTRTGRAIHIVAMSGPAFNVALSDAIEAWGRAVGCNKAFFTGRRGWAKRVPSYTPITYTFQKELDHA